MNSYSYFLTTVTRPIKLHCDQTHTLSFKYIWLFCHYSITCPSLRVIDVTADNDSNTSVITKKQSFHKWHQSVNNLGFRQMWKMVSMAYMSQIWRNPLKAFVRYFIKVGSPKTKHLWLCSLLTAPGSSFAFRGFYQTDFIKQNSRLHLVQRLSWKPISSHLHLNHIVKSYQINFNGCVFLHKRT